MFEAVDEYSQVVALAGQIFRQRCGIGAIKLALRMAFGVGSQSRLVAAPHEQHARWNVVVEHCRKRLLRCVQRYRVFAQQRILVSKVKTSAVPFVGLV